MAKGQEEARLEWLEMRMNEFRENHETILVLPDMEATPTKLVALMLVSYLDQKGDYADFWKG